MHQFDRLKDLPAANNQLLIGGKTVQQIKHIAGKFPCYVYDQSLIHNRLAQLKQKLPKQIQLHYAIKANPMPELVCLLAKHTDGLDVASHKELKTALATGTASKNISFAGPAKSTEELAAAVAADVVLHVESELELMRITAMAKEMGCRANVAIRVNPDFEVKGSGMKMSGGAKPFGIDAEKCPQIIAEINPEYLNFVGLHIFTGSQNLNADSLLAAIEETLKLADTISTESAQQLEQVNIGGGLGIPYFPGEKCLDLEIFCQRLNTVLEQRPVSLSNTQFHMELGRYLVAEAGFYLCEVTDIKESRGKTFLMTNGGMHHHLANSGNFGQVLRRNYPLVIANRLISEINQAVDICGPLCTPLDIIATNLELPKAVIGDVLAIFQSGAYGASASPQQFLSHPEVTELLI